MQQLNNVYDKMLRAMTVNMYRPMGVPNDMPSMDDIMNNKGKED